MLTNKYEMVVIIDAGLEDTAIEQEIDWLLEYMTQHEAEIETVDRWGRRRLAYNIKKKSEGFYAVVRFTAKRTMIADMESEIRLREAFLRDLVVLRTPAADKAYEEAAIEAERRAEQARLRQEEAAESAAEEESGAAAPGTEAPPSDTPAEVAEPVAAKTEADPESAADEDSVATTTE